MKQLPEIIHGIGEGTGAGLLILNEEGKPPYCGKIIRYRSYFDMQEALSKPPLACAVVPGYTISVIFAGVLGRGSRLQLQKTTLAELQSVMEQFAAWYLENKILKDPKGFKKYAL